MILFYYFFYKKRDCCRIKGCRSFCNTSSDFREQSFGKILDKVCFWTRCFLLGMIDSSNDKIKQTIPTWVAICKVTLWTFVICRSWVSLPHELLPRSFIFRSLSCCTWSGFIPTEIWKIQRNERMKKEKNGHLHFCHLWKMLLFRFSFVRNFCFFLSNFDFFLFIISSRKVRSVQKSLIWRICVVLEKTSIKNEKKTERASKRGVSEQGELSKVSSFFSYLPAKHFFNRQDRHTFRCSLRTGQSPPNRHE